MWLASFTWGSILATLVSFALFGILLATQYFQEVRGLDAFGAGVRLLPMIGGMMVGMIADTRLRTGRINSKALVVPGFVLMAAALVAAALAAGAFTTVHSGTGFAAGWFAAVGLGLGLGIAMPTAMNAALGALSAERSGVGSAVITAMRQVGATIGVAILGTVLSSAYRSHLNLAGLGPQAADAVRKSIAGGLAVARHAGSAALADTVRTPLCMPWMSCCGNAAALPSLPQCSRWRSCRRRCQPRRQEHKR